MLEDALQASDTVLDTVLDTIECLDGGMRRQ